MINICLFGGPGVGKSTISTGLFYEMKKLGYKVEYLAEYAKDLVFSKDFYKLKDQVMILANQHHPWFKLESQVDYTVNDGPFFLGTVYLQENPHIPTKEFEEFLVKMYKSYDTINIFLKRSETHPYQEYGRTQTFEEAIEIDDLILSKLKQHEIEFHEFSVDTAIEDILKLLED